MGIDDSPLLKRNHTYPLLIERSQKKGREISLPASAQDQLSRLLKPTHNFVNDIDEYQVVTIVLFYSGSNWVAADVLV